MVCLNADFVSMNCVKIAGRPVGNISRGQRISYTPTCGINKSIILYLFIRLHNITHRCDDVHIMFKLCKRRKTSPFDDKYTYLESMIFYTCA